MRAMIEKRAEKRGQGQGGFTLIELLVVIAILAVLAGVVVFAVGGITDNSQDSACDIDERTVRTAAEAYRADGPTQAALAAGAKGYAADEATLVPGFLAEESDLHDYASASPAAYTVTATAGGPCA